MFRPLVWSSSGWWEQIFKYILMIKPSRCTNFSNLFLQWNSTCVKQVCWQQAVSKPVWHIPLLCVQLKTPDDEQRNCPKHVEFYSKNKFEKLVHQVGIIIRKHHDARSHERQIGTSSLICVRVCSVLKSRKLVVYRRIYRCIFAILIGNTLSFHCLY
jgi:hypothetical protein